MTATPHLEAQAGFTLVELAVVVTIVGVLAAAASFAIDSDRDLRSVTAQAKGRVAEASRLAVAGGPVDADVADNEGFSARSRLFIDTDDQGQFLAVQRRVEVDGGSDTSVWRHVSRVYMPTGSAVSGVETGVARLDSGGAPGGLGDDGVEILCEPTGSCGPATVYLEGSGGKRTRIAVLPFAGAPVTFTGW